MSNIQLAESLVTELETLNVFCVPHLFNQESVLLDILTETQSMQVEVRNHEIFIDDMCVDKSTLLMKVKQQLHIKDDQPIVLLQRTSTTTQQVITLTSSQPNKKIQMVLTKEKLIAMIQTGSLNFKKEFAGILLDLINNEITEKEVQQYLEDKGMASKNNLHLVDFVSKRKTSTT